MIRKIIKALTVVFLLIITLLIGTYSIAIVEYKEYRFLGGTAELIYNQQPNNKLHAYIPIYHTKHRNLGIPLINNKLTYKEPYYYYFTLWGNFDKITYLEASFIHNKINRIAVPISVELLNQKREKSDTWKTKFYFPYGKKFNLPITWEDTDTLAVEINFTGIKNGIERNYTLREDYKKDSIIEDSVNLYWEAMIGI